MSKTVSPNPGVMGAAPEARSISMSIDPFTYSSSDSSSDSSCDHSTLKPTVCMSMQGRGMTRSSLTWTVFSSSTRLQAGHEHAERDGGQLRHDRGLQGRTPRHRVGGDPAVSGGAEATRRSFDVKYSDVEYRRDGDEDDQLHAQRAAQAGRGASRAVVAGGPAARVQDLLGQGRVRAAGAVRLLPRARGRPSQE